MISGQFFHFQISYTFENFLSILLELHYLFVKILTHYKTRLKSAFIMPLHQTNCLTCTYSFKKFYSPKVSGSWVILASKSHFSRDKSMILFGICLFLNTINNTLRQ